MRKSKFSENQIITILKAVEAGRTVRDVCREHEISEATYYQWKTKYGGMEASDIRRLRELEEENRRLKVMYAELSLEHWILKEVLTKSCKAGGQKEVDCRIREQFKVSERLACRVLALGRSVYRYRPQPNRHGEVIKLLLELAHGRPEQGFPKLFKRLRRLGYGWNHKRVYRVYCSLRLNKRRKGKGRLPNRNPAPLSVSQNMNECWSADFMSDALWVSGALLLTANHLPD
jgi:putative transposase